MFLIISIHLCNISVCLCLSSSVTTSVSACDCPSSDPSGSAAGGPAYPGPGSSQSGANVREQERAAPTDGGLTWKTCPLFRVQQSADDRYYFITQRLRERLAVGLTQFSVWRQSLTGCSVISCQVLIYLFIFNSF